MRKKFWQFINMISCWMQNKAWRALDKIRQEERNR